jgi:hypothetical protein
MIGLHISFAVKDIIFYLNPFQTNFSATHILPSSYIILGGKEVGGLLVITEKLKQKQYNLHYVG